MKEADISCPECATEWEDYIPGWVQCPDCEFDFEVDEDGFWLGDEDDEAIPQDELPQVPALSHIKQNATPEFAPLLEASQPAIYNTNAFRVLMLRVETSEREILRQVRQFKLQERFSGGESRVFPFEPSPTLDEVRVAGQRLSDPERRLIDEFFWFWSLEIGQSANDEALLALSNNNAKLAAELWINDEKIEDEDGTSTHNLAILSHMTALNAERHPTPTISNSQQKQRDFHWREAFKRWRTLLENELFWIRLTRRIGDLDEPTLTSGTARQIRASLPLALLSINAQFAVKAAEGGDLADAKRHLQIMRESGFEQSAIDETLRRAILPLRERLKLFCKRATDEAESNPTKANETTVRLFEQTKPLLDIMNMALATGNALRKGLHDEVAFAARSCLMKFVNNTDSYNVFMRLLEIARSIAMGNALRSRLEDDLETARKNLEAQEFEIYLEPIIEQAKALRESALSPQAKLQKARDDLLPRLSDLKEQKPQDSEIVILASNIIARLMREIAVELNNEAEDYELAYEAILTASHHCHDEELLEKISKDLFTIQDQLEEDRRQREEARKAAEAEAKRRRNIRSAAKRKMRKAAEVEAKRLAHEYELCKDLQPVSKSPDVNAVFGIGTKFYGLSDHDYATKSYLATLYAIFFSIPILPLARYRVISHGGNAYSFLGKAELRPLERQHRAIVAPLFQYWQAVLVLGLAAIALVIYVSTISTPPQKQSNANQSPSTVQPSANWSGNSHQTAKPADNKANTNKSTSPALVQTPSIQPLPELTDKKAQPVPSSPPTYIPPAQIDSSREETSRLIREIEVAKLELNQMEKEKGVIKKDLATCKSKIDYYAGIIKRIERDDALGLRIDRTEYESAIKDHNEYVDLHNTILHDLREKETTYNNLLEALNANIRRYNRLIGAQ